MSKRTSTEVRFDNESGAEPPNKVRLELDTASDIESIVLAFRQDGELVELAERTAPVSAEIEGRTDPE